MTQTPNTPAGWYPQGDGERWWDGNAWTEHTRPRQPQPTQQQPVVQAQPYQQPVPQPGQPAYGQPQPAYGTGQPQYPVQPAKQSHTARNVLLILGALFLLFVGGCVAVGVLVTDRVNDAVNDETLGGPNNPMQIEPGEGFEVEGFEYAEGWAIAADASGVMDVKNLKVTNNRGEADRALVQIKLLLGSEVLATSNCSNSGDSIPDGITVTLDCISSDTLPQEYDKVTINDLF